MENRTQDLVQQSVGAWGAHAELAIVQEACADAIAAIAWNRRNHAEVEQLAPEAAGLIVAVEALLLLIGREAVELKLTEKLDDVEVDIEMHKVNPIPMNGVA